VDRVLACGQFEHGKAAPQTTARIDFGRNRTVARNEHRVDALRDLAAEDIDARGLRLVDHRMNGGGHGGEFLVGDDHRVAG
jgi:hypothetical protein